MNIGAGAEKKIHQDLLNKEAVLPLNVPNLP